MSTTKRSTNKSKAPTHIAYQVREGNDDKGFWNRIGAAWPHRDGNGFNIQLDVLPLDGKISLRVPSEDE